MSRKGRRRGPWWYCDCGLPHDAKTKFSEDCTCICCVAKATAVVVDAEEVAH